MGSSKESDERCITHGPWGGSEGKDWVYRPQGITKKLKISVRYAGVVDSINFQTYLTTGKTLNYFCGGKGGNRTDTICLDYPNEYLKSIKGTLGSYDGFNVVTSICFITNQNRYGPYGKNNGNAFSSDCEGGVVVGFFGRANKFLNAIGVYVMLKSLAFGPISICKDKVMLEESCSSMSRMTMLRDAGPWGAGGGRPWDDGVFSKIKKVCVYVGALNAIYALQFEYLKSNGESVLTEVHGGTDGFEITSVVMKDEDEYLTGISGFYGPVEGFDGLEAIVSINFHTNKKIYGPIGEERGAGYSYFSSTASGKVVGVHGRNNGFLGAIGVHMEYF